MKFNICGMQQLGVGVTNLDEAWNWYIKHFGVDCKILDDDSEAKLMLPYTGGQFQRRRAILVLNLQSGGGFEVWQYKGRNPLTIETPISMGDLGINYGKIKCKNIDEAYSFFCREKDVVLNSPTPNPSGNRTFFIRDIYGNIFQIVEAQDWLFNEGKPTGGAYGAIIGVSNIERALPIYTDILGYSVIEYDTCGVFNDFASLLGGGVEVRRVLLKRPDVPSGPFSKLLGQSEIELVCVEGSTRKIYDGRFWGDPGFIHLCFDIQNMAELKKYCESKGYPFTVDSNPDSGTFDMGEAAGHFTYIEDPDGTLIEFVETHKVPILKKMGLYLNLRNKKQGENLPLWILKSLRFLKVKGV